MPDIVIHTNRGTSDWRPVRGPRGPQGPTGPGADVTGAEIEAARDEATEAAGRAEQAAAAAEAGGTTTDAVMAARLADPASQSGQALTGVVGAIAPPVRGPLAGIGKARTGKYRVVLGGTSKAAADDSPIKALAYRLQALYGRARTQVITFMLDGGADGTYLGWQKQHYAGPGFQRAVGTSTSTVRTFEGWGDTVTVYASREQASEAVDYLIDGNVVGQSPAAGTQTFGVKQTFTVAPGRHVLTVNVPTGSGRVHLERIEFSYANDTGVEIVDLTLGGTSMWNMSKDWPAVAGQLAPTPLAAGTTGLAAWLPTDVDLFIGQWLVNDAGSQPQLRIDYQPNWTALADRALAQGQQVITIAEVAGHYALPGDVNHATFLDLYAFLRTLAATRRNVTVVDFHAATIMNDLIAYAARYFPTASGVNPTTGAYAGDFIHEDGAAAYGVCLAALCDRAGVAMPVETQARAVLSSALNPPAPRTAVPTLRTATVGGQGKNLPEVGTSYLPLGRRIVPLLSDVSVASSIVGTLISGSGTSDGYGTYHLTASTYVPITVTAGRTCTVTLTSRGVAAVRVDNVRVRDSDGALVPYTDAANKRTIISVASNAPTTWSFQVSDPDGTPALVLQAPGGVGWRMYGLWLSESGSAVIHPSTAAPSVGLLVATGTVANPGSTAYADPTGLTLPDGTYMVTVRAARADNGAHGAVGTWLVVRGAGRNATTLLGSVTAANSISALSLSLPTTGSVTATATANAGGYTVNFDYSAVRVGTA